MAASCRGQPGRFHDNARPTGNGVQRAYRYAHSFSCCPPPPLLLPYAHAPCTHHLRRHAAVVRRQLLRPLDALRALQQRHRLQGGGRGQAAKGAQQRSKQSRYSSQGSQAIKPTAASSDTAWEQERATMAAQRGGGRRTNTSNSRTARSTDGSDGAAAGSTNGNVPVLHLPAQPWPQAPQRLRSNSPCSAPPGDVHFLFNTQAARCALKPRAPPAAAHLSHVPVLLEAPQDERPQLRLLLRREQHLQEGGHGGTAVRQRSAGGILHASDRALHHGVRFAVFVTCALHYAQYLLRTHGRSLVHPRQ